MKKLSLVLAMVLFVVGFTMAQRTVTGTVVDSESGESLIGANILVKGTSEGASTDIDGKYSINVPEGATTLVASYTGYATLEVELGASNIVDIKMSEGLTIEGVVVTALGVQRDAKAVGYAVQAVDGDQIEKAVTPNVVDALRGQAAGVNVIRSSGTVGGGSRIVIRGQTSLIGNNQPLFIVDGVRIDNSSTNTDRVGRAADNTAGVAQANRAMDINPADIESMNILKGAAATALYGLDGAQGVVIITTKKGKKGSGLNVSFNTSMSFDKITQMPELQNKYAQGWGGAYEAPETGGSTSWGPEISSLEYADPTDVALYQQLGTGDVADAFFEGVYKYDPNGFLVPSGQGNGRAANAYDNVGDFFQTGVGSTNTLSVDGGNDKASFRASYSNHSSEGIVPNNTYDRNTFSIGSSLNVTDKLSITASANYTRSDYTRVQQGSNTSGLLLGLLRTPATFDNAGGYIDPVNTSEAYQFAVDGKQRNYRGGGGYDNPYWTVNNTLRFEKVDRLFGNIGINYAHSPWLNISAKFGTDFYSDTRKQEFEVYSRTVSSGRVVNDDYFNKITDTYFNVTGSGNISDDLTFSYLVGSNMYSSFNENNYKQGDGLAFQDFVHITNAAIVTSDQIINRRKTAGIYASADFGYKGFLYLTLTGRRDWVSTLIDPTQPFDGGKISFFYPSTSLGFVFSEFLNNTDILSFGKIRASYAQVGGGAPFPYVTTTPFVNPNPGDGWGERINFPFNGQTGFIQDNTLGNPNLVPEQTASTELGLDLRFLNGKVNLDATYYTRKSTNLILNASLPASTGSENIYLNSGEIKANGIELVLSATPVSGKKFNWNTRLNFDRNRTNVIKLADGLERLQIGGFDGTGTFLVAGQPYAQLFGGAYLRTGAADYNEANAAANGGNDDGLTIPAGDIVIRDDGSGENGYQIPDRTLRVLGNPNPDFTLGWNNTLSYGPVNFSFLFDWRQGGEMWNGTAWALSFFGMSQLTADSRVETPFAIDGVKLSDGTPNDIQITRDMNYWTSSVGGFGSVDEQFVQETSWYRLRLISLGVDLDPAWFGLDGKVQSANLSVTGRNLWFSTPYEGVDPETSLEGNGNAQGFDYFNMPSTSSWTIGLNVRF